MKQHRNAAPATALLLLFCLSGCSALPVWEDFLGQKGFLPPPESSPAAPAPEPTAAAPATPSPAPAGEETPCPEYPEYIEEPEYSEQIPYEDLSLELLQDEILQSGNKVGLAFLGYVDSQSSEVDLRDYLMYSDAGRAYPFLPMSWLLMVEGQELYAVVPPDETTSITIYASGVNEWGEYVDDTSMPLGENWPGEPLLLQCNLSEIYANVLVVVNDGSETITFRPSLSMEDGHLVEIPGVYDFSLYPYKPDESDVQVATERLLQWEEVDAAMQRGMKLMYTGDVQRVAGYDCLLFVLGTDTGDQFVREQYYAVCDAYIFAYDAVEDVWHTCDA